jgi:DNA polymerase III subunit beta
MDSSASSDVLHLEAPRDVLLAALQAADAVVPANSTKPILTHLMLECVAGRLVVHATDQQVGLRCVVHRIDAHQHGLAVVQARQLVAILKESSSQSVLLRVQQSGEATTLGILLSDGEYTVPTVVGEVYPAVQPFPQDAQAFVLPGKRCEEMLTQTAFAMDKDRTSAVLSGLSLSIGNGELSLAATDGKVLAEAVEHGERFRTVNGERITVVVPASTVNHLQRIITGTQPGGVDIAVAGKIACMRLALPVGIEIELTSRLVDGTFPAYRNALTPSTTPQAVRFRTTEIASAVRRAALMTSATSRGIIVTLDIDRAIFANLNFAAGSARIPVTCQYTGNPQRLGIDSRYLADVLKVYKGEEFSIEIGRGLVMREAGASYLIMPIALP